MEEMARQKLAWIGWLGRMRDRMAVEDACAHSMAFRCGMWEVLWLHRKYLVARVAAAPATAQLQQLQQQLESHLLIAHSSLARRGQRIVAGGKWFDVAG